MEPQLDARATNGFMIQVAEKQGLGAGQKIETEMAKQAGDDMFLEEVQARLHSLRARSGGSEGGCVLTESFPTWLSSLQRKHVHLLAKSMGLFSHSLGEGPDRFITVCSAPVDLTEPKQQAAAAEMPLAPHFPAVPVSSSSTDTCEPLWRERLSRALSAVLRHRAQEEGVKLGSDGFAELRAVLASKPLQRLRATQERVELLIEKFDPKQRFVLRRRDDGVLLIRAAQGHTMKVVRDEELLKPVCDPEGFPVCVHGTSLANWKLIRESGGLSRMNRNHIHFVPRPPGHNDVVSGFRGDSDVAVYLNLASALNAGISFFESDNSVILSPGDENGTISLVHVERAENILAQRRLWPLPFLPVEEGSEEEEHEWPVPGQDAAADGSEAGSDAESSDSEQLNAFTGPLLR